MATIDVDRGVTIKQIVRFDKANPNKFVPDPTYGGMTVYMYKDEPGKYYDVHGRLLPEGMAEKAGFDVKSLAKQRHRREKLKEFDDRLAQELALEMGEEVILKEAGDWKVVALPMERAKVIDKESGEAITQVPMTRPEAIALLDSLTSTASDIKKVTGNAVKEK